MKKYAIVGMSGRFPLGDNPEDLFKNLIKGKTSFRNLNEDEINDSPYKNEKHFIPITSGIRDVYKFDNNFFKMNKIDSSTTDPQQRIFLKCCYEALEDSSIYYTAHRKIGVFGSSSQSSYLLSNILSNNNDLSKFDHLKAIGNDTDFNATRVSYKLNLEGPSMSIQSGCSSSLVALNEAIGNIENGNCEAALVGGVSITFPLHSGYAYKEGSPFSKTGHMRPFDKKADGMVKGDGCGVIVIEPYESAIINNHNIYSIISGIGINNDGNEKVGYTAPSIKGERDSMLQALKASNISSDSVDFVETHGTGTKLGDLIESRALSQVYGLKKRQLIGSIKANIGHLDTASGITGLIKASLILKNGIVPKSVGFDYDMSSNTLEKNNLIIETKKNINLNSRNKHYVGVSSFGIGGTNVHVILENYIDKKTENYFPNERVNIAISAKTQNSLNNFKTKLSDYLENHPKLNILDVAKTINSRNRTYSISENYSGKSVLELSNNIKNNITTDSDITIKKGKNIYLPSYCFDERDFKISAKHLSDKKNIKKTNIEENVNILELIMQIWTKYLDEEVSSDSDFFELNGDSLVAISIIEDINKKFNTKFDTNNLLELSTPRQIALSIENKKEIPYHNVHLLKKGSNTKKIFLIHAAGGSVFYFNNLVRFMQNTDYEIYALSFPNDISVDISLKELSSIYTSEIKQIQQKGPYVLGGYSFGGNVAVQIASNLENKGEKVNKVIMIDSLVPEVYPQNQPQKSSYLKLFPIVWSFMVNKTMTNKYSINKKIYTVDKLIIEMRNINQISNDIKTESVKKLFKVWTNNFNALIKQNLDKVNCNILLLKASDYMPDNFYENMNLKKNISIDWLKYTNGQVKKYIIKGNHYTIMSQEKALRYIATLIEKNLYD